MTAPAVGVVFLPQLPPERLQATARAADAAGIDQLWLWEDCFRESGIASAAASLAWSRRLHVGVGLMPAPLRNVALAAMEIATVARLFPGRFHVGIGHGVQDWMGQVGARVTSPLTLLREYLDALARLLAGERVTVSGRYVRLDGVALDWPPSVPPRVLGGAVGPRTMTLCGERAGGTLLTGGTTASAVGKARALIDEVRARAGLNDPHPITVYLIAAIGPGAQERLAAELRKWSLDAGEDVAVAGDARAVAAAAQRWIDAGAETVVFQPTEDEPDLEGFLDAVGREVRPRLIRRDATMHA